MPFMCMRVCLECVCIVVCVCVVCVFCVNPCSVRYRVHGGVYNSQPSIDQDVRMRDFLLGCRMFGAGSGFNLELSSGSAGCAVAFWVFGVGCRMYCRGSEFNFEPLGLV
jgi:hypothetical protein